MNRIERPITEFVKTLDKNKEYELGELHELHVQWCKENRFHPLNQKSLRECFQSITSVYCMEMMVSKKKGKYFLTVNKGI